MAERGPGGEATWRASANITCHRRRSRAGGLIPPNRADRRRPRRPLLPTARSLDAPGDRKSTRLNSSYSQMSYAAFCLNTKIMLEDFSLITDIAVRYHTILYASVLIFCT